MDFSGIRYYKLNRMLLIALGLWPDNNPVLKRIRQTFFILLLAFSICVQFAKIITFASDLESLFRILSFAIPCLAFSLKYATFCIKSSDIQKLMEQIKYNWILTKRKKELEILHRYASIGYLFTIALIAIFYAIILMFLSTQMLPKLLDIVAPLNESRPCKLLGVAAFFFDDQKYFVAIFLHMTVALFVETTTIIATETTSLAYIQHSCALFKITRLRIENLVDYEFDIPVSVKEMVLRANIIDVIIGHNKAIEYFEFINSTFGISYFLLLILGVCSLSINIFRAIYTGEMKEAFAIALFIFCHFFYMFMNNFIGQNITNVSFDIFYATCNLPWYTFPVRLQKMIGLIIRKSMIGNKFIMASLFEGSLECFTSIVSISMSYFTVFWSMHH